ncbi:MAG: polysaccharide deacetylase family protein [Lachnospiraceae bacterium]|nr:polysaccharide deacetylase family protein [Lachnospiraceae bacterium]
MISLKNGDGITWPGGKRIALMVTFDYDLELLRECVYQKKLGFADVSRGLYGTSEGLDRCLDVLEKNEVKGTFFIPGAIAEKYPEDVKKIDAAGHEIGYHGWMPETSLDLTKEQETVNMEKAERTLMELTGKKPVGARGWRNITYAYTPTLLRERGYRYSSIMKDCDWAYAYPKEPSIIELPTEHTMDDYTYFFFSFDHPQHRANYPVDYVFEIWKDTLDELASEGDKVMVLKLHPQFIGRSSRAVMLNRFLTYAREQGAWIATCEEVAAYVQKYNGQKV